MDNCYWNLHLFNLRSEFSISDQFTEIFYGRLIYDGCHLSDYSKPVNREVLKYNFKLEVTTSTPDHLPKTQYLYLPKDWKLPNDWSTITHSRDNQRHSGSTNFIVPWKEGNENERERYDKHVCGRE